MHETLTLLIITAHLISDFVLQPNWITQRTSNLRTLLILMLRMLVVAGIMGLAVGHWDHPLVLFLSVSHFAIDLLKTYILPDRLWAFLVEQALNLIAIFAGAWYFPDCAQTGVWFQMLQNPADRQTFMQAVTILGGLILGIPAGGVLISKTVKPFLTDEQLKKCRACRTAGGSLGI